MGLGAYLSRRRLSLFALLGFKGRWGAELAGVQHAELCSLHHLTVKLVLYSYRPLLAKWCMVFMSYCLVSLQIFFVAAVAAGTIYSTCITGTRDCLPGLWCPDVLAVTPPLIEMLRASQGSVNCAVCGSWYPHTTKLVPQEEFAQTCIATEQLCAANASRCQDPASYLVLTQCQGCSYPDTLRQSGLPIHRTLQEAIRIDIAVMSFGDMVSLVLVSIVLVLSMVDELFSIRLMEISIRDAIRCRRGDEVWLWVLCLEYLIILIKYVLLPMVYGAALLFVLVLGVNAYSLALNVLVLLFVLEIDDQLHNGISNVLDFEALLEVLPAYASVAVEAPTATDAYPIGAEHGNEATHPTPSGPAASAAEAVDGATGRRPNTVKGMLDSLGRRLSGSPFAVEAFSQRRSPPRVTESSATSDEPKKLLVEFDKTDRSAILYGQLSFFMVGVICCLLTVRLIVEGSSLTDFVAEILLDPDLDQLSRQIVGSLIQTVVFLGTLVVSASHILEGFGRRRGIRKKLLLVVAVALQAICGLFIGKECLKLIGTTSSDRAQARTQPGYVAVGLNCLVCCFLGFLAARGDLRGGYGVPISCSMKRALKRSPRSCPADHHATPAAVELAVQENELPPQAIWT